MAEKNPDALKITNQFRSRTGFVYDLKYEAVRLTVEIARRQNPDEPGEWHMEVRVSSVPDAAPIDAWAETRRDALTEVGRVWANSAPELGLPTVDWVAVATALSDVRAV